MGRKIVAIGVVAILALCMVPATFEESDASVTERSVNALYMAKFTYKAEYSYVGGMLFLEDSANHKVMKGYIEDPLHAQVPIQDDRDEIFKPTSVGKMVYAYDVSSSIYYNTNNGDSYDYGEFDATRVVERMTISFFVREGDTFKIDIIEATKDEGTQRPSIILVHGLTTEYLSSGDSYTDKYLTNTVVYIQPEYATWAVDVTYVASGYSAPNGSSVVFIAAAIVISVTILAILILAGLHPRWES